MADLIDRKQLISALESAKVNCPDIFLAAMLTSAIQVVEAQPSVDGVEVVRCKDCQYWNPRYETMGMCMKHNSIVTFTKPDFYCAWGKGKNDGICKEG